MKALHNFYIINFDEEVMNPKHCKWFVLIILVPSLCVWMAMNLLVNPFDFYPFPPLHRVNDVKVAMGVSQRLHCAMEIARQKPLGIVLGTSRCNNGIDPVDLEKLGYPHVFNSGFGQSNMKEKYYFLEHALYHQPDLKLVVIGLDFFNFGKGNSVKRGSKHGFSLNDLKGNTFSPLQYFHFLFKPLSHSYKTWNANYSEDLDLIYLDNGLWNPILSANPKINPFFDKTDIDFVRYVLRTKEYYSKYKLSYKQIHFFKKIVRLCRDKNIELKVFFTPPKVLYWEAIYRSQLWPTFETLKRELAAIYPFWDFSGFNCVTTEAIDTKENPLYYECSHFRPYVGRLILDRMYHQPHAIQNFGYYITAENVEDALQSIRQDRLKWLETQPANLKELDNELSLPESLL